MIPMWGRWAITAFVAFNVAVSGTALIAQQKWLALIIFAVVQVFAIEMIRSAFIGMAEAERRGR